jgi:AcrR family transcriptional regulator
MNPPVKRPNSRETILDSAEAIVLKAGAAHLTLDAVAERAGVSKGGLLYNFPSKETLLQAMIARHLDRCRQLEADILARLPAGPGRELKASVLSALNDKCGPDAKRLSVALMAAGANDPKLLEPVLEFHRCRLARLEAAAASGLRFERMAAVSLAMDGLFLTEMLQLSPYHAAQRQSIIEGLLQIIEEEVAIAVASGISAPPGTVTVPC